MPSFFNKLTSRWNNKTSAPKYGPIGPIPLRDVRTPWRQRLAKLIGVGQTLPLRTASYRPLHQAWFHQPRDLPPFTFQTINSMLLDPGIRLNLAMRAAPIYGVQFAYPSGVDAAGKTIYQPGIQARNPAVAAWVARQLSTIWHNDLPAILRSQVYGWAGGEVALRFTDNSFIEIDRLVPRHPGDVRLLKCEGRRYGVKVLRVQDEGDVSLQFPAAWFHTFRPDDGEDYGTSILLGAYSPWADKWFNGGALDTRRLFMHKDAYGGMKIAYPEEDLYIGNEAIPTSARDIAAQMVEQRKAGGTITYPSTLDMQGNPKWRIEEATTANNPQHILQYPKDCDDEIRIGMEIPDDVISNDGSGAWAGKRIPLAAFYASLDTWVVQILADLRHTLEPLIMLNWGRAEDFEICHKPLALQAMEQQGQAAAPAAPPDLSAQAPVTTAQAGMLSRISPHRMSLNTRPSVSAKEQAQRYQRAHLMAALLTRIYGPEAERYFDEAFGTNLHDTNSTYSTTNRHPHEFQRLSTQISRSIGLARVPWDPLKHPRGRDGRFIEKYGAGAFIATQSQINATLDPNANPSRGRVSDDVRPLLEHLNILDDSQLHNLASDYEVRPDQTSKSPFADAIHHQIYGEEPDIQPYDEKPQDRNAVLLHSDPPAKTQLVSTNAQREEHSVESNLQGGTATATAPQALPEDEAAAQRKHAGNQVLSADDIPADFEVKDASKLTPGQRLSAYIRSQHKAAFDLADQVVDSQEKLSTNAKDIERVQKELANVSKGSAAEARLQAELRQLTLQQGILTQQLKTFTDRLNTEFGDLELPGFTYLTSDYQRVTIPGGTGGQALIDRILRDRQGYDAIRTDGDGAVKEGEYLAPKEDITYNHHPEEVTPSYLPGGEDEDEEDSGKTIGIEDVPHEFSEGRKWESDGRTISEFTRNQHKDAFRLADTIVDTATEVAKAERQIAALRNQIGRQSGRSSRTNEDIRKDIHSLELANDVRRRDIAQLSGKLDEQYSDVEIPSFRYHGASWYKVPGGTGGQAILDRALRDRDHYDKNWLSHVDAPLIPVSDFDMADVFDAGLYSAVKGVLKAGARGFAARHADDAIKAGDGHIDDIIEGADNHIDDIPKQSNEHVDSTLEYSVDSETPSSSANFSDTNGLPEHSVKRDQSDSSSGLNKSSGKEPASSAELKNVDVEQKERESLRDRYTSEVHGLKQEAERLGKQGHPEDEIARKLYDARREIGVKYKQQTPPDLLDFIHRYNIDRYKDPLGPSFESLAKDKSYRKIIDSASKPLGDKKQLGKALYKHFGDEVVPTLKKYDMLPEDFQR